MLRRLLGRVAPRNYGRVLTVRFHRYPPQQQPADPTRTVIASARIQETGIETRVDARGGWFITSFPAAEPGSASKNTSAIAVILHSSTRQLLTSCTRHLLCASRVALNATPSFQLGQSSLLANSKPTEYSNPIS